MDQFVKDHVTRVFKDDGYDLLDIHGDRGGIVQGDGLHLTVTPDISAAARRFSKDGSVIAQIEDDAASSRKLTLHLYGGSAAPDREGVLFDDEFIDFLKEECSDIYYKAQSDVNAIFDAEDVEDGRWDGRRNAYVGTVDEFAIDDNQGRRVFVTVYRIADQSFNGYESGDEEADRADVADIIEGRSSHGSIEITLHWIDTDSMIGSFEPFRMVPEDEYDILTYRDADALEAYVEHALTWPRDDRDAHTLDLASEIARDAGHFPIADALKARAVERGLENSIDETAAPTL